MFYVNSLNLKQHIKESKNKHYDFLSVVTIGCSRKEKKKRENSKLSYEPEGRVILQFDSVLKVNDKDYIGKIVLFNYNYYLANRNWY